MGFRSLSFILGAFLAISVGGCGGGSSSSLNNPNNPVPLNTVTVAFTDGTPAAVAAQIGTGAFNSVSLQNGKLSLTVPQGTTKYAIAYICPDFNIGDQHQIESVIEATLQDGNTYNVSCSSAPTLITGSVQLDASALPGTLGAMIFGPDGVAGGDVPGGGFVSGPLGYNLPAGTYDVAVATIGSSGLTAIKILRSQTIPGAINGGNTVVFASSDEMAQQAFTVTNIPAGFTVLPATEASYQTASGARILLNFNSPPQYPAIPTSAVQSGDFYRYDAIYADPQNRAIGVTQATSNGGGAVALALPPPWTYSGPSPATFPAFVFEYTGFNAVMECAQIEWSLDPASLHGPFALITVTATASFQNGGNSITVPPLSNLPGFFGPAPSGATVTWIADIFGGATPSFPVQPTLITIPTLIPNNVPPNSTMTFVQTQGTYTQP